MTLEKTTVNKIYTTEVTPSIKINYTMVIEGETPSDQLTASISFDDIFVGSANFTRDGALNVNFARISGLEERQLVLTALNENSIAIFNENSKTL